MHRASSIFCCTLNPNVLNLVSAYTGTSLEGKMVQSVVPEPYGNLHLSWLAGLANKPPPSSCRAGAVVNFQAVNGAKVPVTLDIRTVDTNNGDTSEFVVKVRTGKLATAGQGLVALCRSVLGSKDGWLGVGA